jgi:CBS domain containing-hemolysin-like protein
LVLPSPRSTLGWIGEPALANLVEPLLIDLPSSVATTGSHVVGIALSFTIITTLHIVFGELAPKSLALQRGEVTALAVVRPLRLFLFLLRPAIVTLNGLGNLVLRLFGLRPGTGEESLHSPEELKFLIRESQDAGILQETQEEVVLRVLNIGERRIRDIMTIRPDIDWIDAEDDREAMLRTIRASRHEQLLVSRGSIEEPLGMILKKDLLDLVLDDHTIDPLAVIREPLVVHETVPIFKVLEMFKKAPVRLAIVVDEYGGLEGIVTQTDLFEAIVGNLPEAEDEQPYIVEREDGSLLIDGMTAAHDAFDRRSTSGPGQPTATFIRLPDSPCSNSAIYPKWAKRSHMAAGASKSSVSMAAASARLLRRETTLARKACPNHKLGCGAVALLVFGS